MTSLVISASSSSIILLYLPFFGVRLVSLNNSNVPFVSPVIPGMYGFEENSRTLFIGRVEGYNNKPLFFIISLSSMILEFILSTFFSRQSPTIPNIANFAISLS